jgi:hypothetical protein
MSLGFIPEGMRSVIFAPAKKISERRFCLAPLIRDGKSRRDGSYIGRIGQEHLLFPGLTQVGNRPAQQKEVLKYDNYLLTNGMSYFILITDKQFRRRFK